MIAALLVTYIIEFGSGKPDTVRAEKMVLTHVGTCPSVTFVRGWLVKGQYSTKRCPWLRQATLVRTAAGDTLWKPRQR